MREKHTCPHVACLRVLYPSPQNWAWDKMGKEEPLPEGESTDNAGVVAGHLHSSEGFFGFVLVLFF